MIAYLLIVNKLSELKTLLDDVKTHYRHCIQIFVYTVSLKVIILSDGPPVSTFNSIFKTTTHNTTILKVLMVPLPAQSVYWNRIQKPYKDQGKFYLTNFLYKWSWTKAIFKVFKNLFFRVNVNFFFYSRILVNVLWLIMFWHLVLTVQI